MRGVCVCVDSLSTGCVGDWIRRKLGKLDVFLFWEGKMQAFDKEWWAGWKGGGLRGKGVEDSRAAGCTGGLVDLGIGTG